MAEVLNTRGDSFARFSRRIVLMLASSYAFGVESLSADAEIGEQTAPFLAVTASGAARALSFVAAVERDGGVQIVYNAGATYNVVVKNSAAATLITLAPGEFVALVYDATAWAVLWKVTASSVPTISPIRIAFPDAATSPTTEGQLLYNADHLELHDGTGARSILMSDDIGVVVQAYSAILAWLIATNSVPVVVQATPAAESGNAIAVALQIGANSGSVARVQRLHCRLYDASMLEALVASWTMAETGAGSEVSTTARPALLIDTDGNGAATVTVTDVSGSFAGTMYLEVAPVNAPGSPTIVALTFA